MYKLGFEEAVGPQIELPTFVGSWRKQGSSTKTVASLTKARAFDCVDHNKLWKILKEMGIPNHLTCLLRKLYASQEAKELNVEFQIGKEVCQGYTLSACLFNLNAAYIILNAGLNEAQMESRLLGKISITTDMQMQSYLWQKSKKN